MSSSFNWKQFLRQVAVIAIPVALQNLLTTTGSMVDTMMIGQLGQTHVGAVGLCAQFSSLMFSCYWGFVGGGMLFFSQYWGAQDHEGIHRSYGVTWTCMMTVGVTFWLLASLAPEQVMRLYTDKPEFQAIGCDYLRIVGFAYPLMVQSMAMASLLRSTERVRIPFWGALVSVCSNVLLNWLLIFGHWGLPALGVKGAALATVLANALNVAVIALLSRLQGHPYVLAVRKHFHWNRDFLKIYFRKCFPIMVNEVCLGIGNMLINVVLGRQSAEAIAATAVFRTLEGLIIGFFAGFSSASSVLVGKEIGAGNLELAQQRAKRLVYLCMGFIGLTGAVIILLHTPILTAMSLRGESFDIAFGMILIFCAVAIIRMGNWVQNDTYRAAGDAKFGTVLEITFLFAMVVPLVWLSGMVWHWPFLAVFALCYCDEPIRFALMHMHLYSLRWIQPVTPEGQAALPALMQAHSKAGSRGRAAR